MTRRELAGIAAAATVAPANHARLALLGGMPIRSKPFPSWPVVAENDERGLVEVLRSGRWYRRAGRQVERFEGTYARLMGTEHCVATANGTGALLTSLAALGVGPGDEVIVPPYTFVATVNVVLLRFSLPVFVDSDLETFQIDAGKIEAAITGRTAAVIPVHLGGAAADLDTILATARRKSIPVIEDACQAHLAEWKGRKVGTYGATGCFSFQGSKNLNCGEGGAILTGDADLARRCFAFHNNGRGATAELAAAGEGANLRLTEFQASLLLSQMERLESQTQRREENARYLTGLLAQIPGVKPARAHPGCTRNAFHLFMFRVESEAFRGVPKERLLQALRAEGIPCSGGYEALNRAGFLKAALASKGFQRVFPEKELAAWEERTRCPMNDRLCREAVWLTQPMLLGSRTDMEQIAEAVAKVQRLSGDLHA